MGDGDLDLGKFWEGKKPKPLDRGAVEVLLNGGSSPSGKEVQAALKTLRNYIACTARELLSDAERVQIGEILSSGDAGGFVDAMSFSLERAVSHLTGGILTYVAEGEPGIVGAVDRVHSDLLGQLRIAGIREGGV